MDAADSEIVRGLRQGAPEALRALYEAHGRSVLAYLTRLTGRKEMAEELTQETFLAAIRKIGFFRTGSDGGLKPWVFRIATNLAFDSLRRERRVELAPGDELGAGLRDESPGPHERLESAQLGRELQALLAALTPGQRMVFLLKEQEELSLLEISRVCGLSENAVKQTLFRARAALRGRLGGAAVVPLRGGRRS